MVDNKVKRPSLDTHGENLLLVKINNITVALVLLSSFVIYFAVCIIQRISNDTPQSKLTSCFAFKFLNNS